MYFTQLKDFEKITHFKNANEFFKNQ